MGTFQVMWLSRTLRGFVAGLRCFAKCGTRDTVRGMILIIINSAYRSWEVNKKVGGSSTSNHLVGCAADIKCLGKEQALRYAVILLDIADESKEDFDELLIERSSRGNYWIHFAVRPPTRGNRRKVKFIQA